MSKAQSETIKRIEEVCNEFDERMKSVGVAIARLELAKALVESEISTCYCCRDGGCQEGCRCYTNVSEK